MSCAQIGMGAAMAGELRLLVRVAPGTTNAELSIGGRPTPVSLVPLFQSIHPEQGLGLAAGTQWHLAVADADDRSPWDACHRAVHGGLGLAGGVEFAEPDFEQQWPWSTPARQVLGMAGDCPEKGEPQNGDTYAMGPYSTWYKGRHYSQLGDAAQQVGVPSDTKRIQIAHLDTGFDPNHSTRPEHLNLELQRNFVDDDRPFDATDRPTALINPMFGHGTGTLGLLAGNRFGDDNQHLGGAPQCSVVPIRVANWVVLFRNSAIAKAFDYVHGLWDDPKTRVHVVTMSMGGIASAAWADAVNALYERGIFVVTAAGNNFANLPTRYTVYPARFHRVVAACGVMADGRAYADLPRARMAGCYGPRSKEPTSMAAYTPNVPWAKFGCPVIVDWDGGGTSAATPQIAAAAALWMQKHRDALEGYAGWARVEATRKALFDASLPAAGELARRLGRGVLQANAALGVAPADVSTLVRQQEDSASFGLFKVLTGLGLQGELSPRHRMLELEALQLSQQSQDIEAMADDVDLDNPAFANSSKSRRLLEAFADHPAASDILKRAVSRKLAAGGQTVTPSEAVGVPSSDTAAQNAPYPAPSRDETKPAVLSSALDPEIPVPPHRSLKVYAFDPLVATRLETVDINQAIVKIRWEDSLRPGPIGEYFEVVDIDPPADAAYAPVDLNHPSILAQQGLVPSEGNPQFHQQMVYAVAMRTVERFEAALGRRAQWAGRRAVVDGDHDWRFVRRLRIYPHALRERNAFYSPDKRALLFGYFNASGQDVGGNLPGGLIFTCLSHDIVAHETTHALLDGLHPYYKEPSSLDMLAFHEAFADIVALLQHFTLPEALRSELAKVGGKLELADLLAGLALQFGEGIGHRGALRSAIAHKPSPTDYSTAKGPHALGAVLVAAVFDAFLQIYRRKTDDLYRLASGGTGVMPAGRVPHDLVERLAREAAKIAGRVLNICVRALDYCPPVDLTFGEYLRALITADRDLVPDDPHGYRVAFISAFRARGIFPTDVNNLSVDGLAWQRPDIDVPGLADALRTRADLSWHIDSDRYGAYIMSNKDAKMLHELLREIPDSSTTFAALGLYPTISAKKVTIDGQRGKISKIEVHSVRPVRRVAPDNSILNDVIIEMAQTWRPDAGGGQVFRGGCTLVCDRATGRIRYVIRKRVGNPRSVKGQMEFRLGMAGMSSMQNYFSEKDTLSEPFAMMHRH